MATTAASGDLLQPSYPLAPTDKMLFSYPGGNFDGTALWATYTSVPSAASAAAGAGAAGADSKNIWYVAMAYCAKPGNQCHSRGPPPNVTLLESDLAPMVDASSPPATLFDAIPKGAFNGSGAAFPASAAVSGHVAWSSRWLQQGLARHAESGAPASSTAAAQADACAGISVAPFGGATKAGAVMQMTGTQLLNVAPLFSSGTALLGEAGKVTAVSTYRFASVSATSATIRGKAGEVVELLFAKKSGAAYTCSSLSVKMPGSGTAVVKFP